MSPILPETLSIPAEVLRIATKLEDAGFETWCVGGAVRDQLLGYEGKDVDLATSAKPNQVRRLFRRTIPVGIEHGTVAVLDRDKKPHEVTTFRKDVKTDGRHAEVEFGVSLDEDLARRDFTINAIAYHPLRHEWRDLFGGVDDMEAKVIRAVGDPAQRFREDYLRILRALRFAARFGFEIEAATWHAINSNVAGLQHLSAERVRDEWFRGIAGARSVCEFVGLWRDVGAVEVWLPEGGRSVGRYGGRSVGRYGGRSVGRYGGRSVGRYGGKSVGTEGGVSEERVASDVLLGGIDRIGLRDPVLVTSFLSTDPAETLTRLKCSRAEIERGRRIGRFRGRWPDPESAVSVRKWMAEVGEAADDLVWLARVEGVSEGLGEAVKRFRMLRAPLSIRDLAVTGDDLIAAGVEKGPMVGKTLRRLLDLVVEHPELNRKAELLRHIDE